LASKIASALRQEARPWSARQIERWRSCNRLGAGSSACNWLAVVDVAAVELASAGDVDGEEVEGSAAGSAMSVQVDALVRLVRSRPITSASRPRSG
jgi:hypothetical protein